MVRQVRREDPGTVGGDHHVVLRRALGEGRHLRLHLHVAGVGAPRAAGVLEDPLLDDLGAELGRRPAVGLGERLVLGVAARDQEPRLQRFQTRILRQRVGQDRVGRRDVQQVRPAVLAAQPVAGRHGVDDDRPVAGLVGQPHGGVLVRQRHDPPDPGVEQRLHLRLDRLRRRDDGLGDEGLPHERAGGGIVGGAEHPARRTRDPRAAARAARSASAPAHPPAARPPCTPPQSPSRPTPPERRPQGQTRCVALPSSRADQARRATARGSE